MGDVCPDGTPPALAEEVESGLRSRSLEEGSEVPSPEGYLGEYEGGGLDTGDGRTLSWLMGSRSGFEKSIVFSVAII